MWVQIVTKGLELQTLLTNWSCIPSIQEKRLLFPDIPVNDTAQMHKGIRNLP